MNTVDLKILAGAVIVECKLDKQSKGQLLEWIQNEASKVDVMGFLLDGRVQHFEGYSEQIVVDRFEAHELSEGWGKTILGMFILSPVGWVAYRLIRAVFSKSSRKCGVLSIGKPRDLCFIRVKMTKAEKLLSLFKRELANCSKSKNPDKCKAKGSAQIDKYSAELRQLQARIQDMKGSGGGVEVSAGGGATIKTG